MIDVNEPLSLLGFNEMRIISDFNSGVYLTDCVVDTSTDNDN